MLHRYPQTTCDNRKRVQDGHTIQVEQAVDDDGTVRLRLRGELDQASTPHLTSALDALRVSGEPVRLDLSSLDFIDSSGVRTILLTVREARSAGWELTVDRELSWQVQRVFDTLGIDAALWPEDGAGP